MIGMPITVEIPETEGWDPVKEEFVPMKSSVLILEHSLLSISKWESKWKKAFLDPRVKKTTEEVNDYIRCMTINQNVNPLIYNRITAEQMKQITDYIQDPMTATWISDKGSKRDTRTMTSELIYCQMVMNGIPFECEKWHLNRLIMLIRVCNAESSPKKKMSRGDLLRQYKSVNAARRKPHVPHV